MRNKRIKSPVSLFYDRMYKDNADNAKPKGMVGYIFSKLRKFELHRVDATIKLLPNGNNILDIGCGRGDLLIKCFKENKYKKYYGTDISVEVIKNAQNNVNKNVANKNKFKLQVADVDGDLPFKKNYFDTVTFIATLEHIFDPYHVLKEINRVTKKGGVLVIEVPNFVWLPRRVQVLLGNIPSTGDEGGWDSGHLHYFSFENTSQLLKECGYKVVYKGSSGVFSKLRNIYPELLSANIIIKAIKKYEKKN